MRIWPINFRKQFAPLILEGAKTQTVRAHRKDKRRPQPGDMIHCYTGMRTSTTVCLLRASIIEVNSIEIELDRPGVEPVWINGQPLHGAETERFARADGFDNWKHMELFFLTQYGKVTRGVVIIWAKP